MPVAPPILFLDIDGVLASGRSWLLPENAALIKEMSSREVRHARRKEMALATTFDPCAIALVNRLCDVTSCRIVIHSYWRRTVGGVETRGKLIEQGIKAEHFHDNAVCPMWASSEKVHDINGWLDDNRVTERPEEPEFMYSFQAVLNEETERARDDYHAKLNDHGITFVVIDDEHINPYQPNFPQVKTDFAEGLTVRDYRIACAVLGASDPMMGVHPVSSDDTARVLAAFENYRVPAMHWLHDTSDSRFSRARLLDAAYQEATSKGLEMLGYGGMSAAHALESRNKVLTELAGIEKERDERKAEADRWLAEQLSGDF